jgi:hypothetical protein
MAAIAALLVLLLLVGVRSKRFGLGTRLLLAAGICGLLLALYLG